MWIILMFYNVYRAETPKIVTFYFKWEVFARRRTLLDFYWHFWVRRSTTVNTISVLTWHVDFDLQLFHYCYFTSVTFVC